MASLLFTLFLAASRGFNSLEIFGSRGGRYFGFVWLNSSSCIVVGTESERPRWKFWSLHIPGWKYPYPVIVIVIVVVIVIVIVGESTAYPRLELSSQCYWYCHCYRYCQWKYCISQVGNIHIQSVLLLLSLLSSVLLPVKVLHIPDWNYPVSVIVIVIVGESTGPCISQVGNIQSVHLWVLSSCFRSGSSLVGELVSSLPNASYFFEPLHSFPARLRWVQLGITLSFNVYPKKMFSVQPCSFVSLWICCRQRWKNQLTPKREIFTRYLLCLFRTG